MTKYLLLKLAEEAGELVVAAIKHGLHKSHATRRALEGEIADVLAVIELLFEYSIDVERVAHLTVQRKNRERKRMEKR